MDSNRYIKPKRWWTNVGGHVFTFSGRPVWQEKDIFQRVSCGVSCRCSAIVLIEFSRVFYYLRWNAVFPFSWTWTCQTAHTHFGMGVYTAKCSGLGLKFLWSYKRHHCAEKQNCESFCRSFPFNVAFVLPQSCFQVDVGRKEWGSMTSWWCVRKARQHFVHFWILTATFLWVLQGRFSPWICRASDGWWWYDDIGGSAHGKARNTLDTVLSALQHKAQGDASTLQFGGMMWNASIIFYPSIKLMFAFVPHNGDVHRFSVPPALMMAENSESTMSIFDPQNKDVTWSLRIQRQRRKTSCCFSSWIFPSPHCRVKLTRFSLHVAASHQHFSFAWFDSLSRSIVDSRIVFSSLQRLRATMTRLENLFKICNAWFFKLLRYYEKWHVESLNEFNAPSCTSLNWTVWKTSSRLKPEMSNWKDLFLDSLVIFFLKFAESTQCNCVFLFATNPRSPNRIQEISVSDKMSVHPGEARWCKFLGFGGWKVGQSGSGHFFCGKQLGSYRNGMNADLNLSLAFFHCSQWAIGWLPVRHCAA